MKLIQEILFNPEKEIQDPRVKKLKALYPECFNKFGEFMPNKFAEIMAQQPTSQESYAQNWLGKSYAQMLPKLPPVTLLTEDQVHNAKPENANSENLLIKGDNLEVLKHLKNAYSNKIKMIYIDPPYNTGSDGFVYQDDRKFSAEQLSQLGNMNLETAQRVLTFTSKKSNSHSAWLTFMYPRLYIARELLTEDGVIFISIDDNEVAQLKLLCDEVFGEGNFVANIIWYKKYGIQNNAKLFSVNHDHILVFAKNINLYQQNLLPRTEKQDDRYANIDNDPRGVWKPGDLSVGSTTEKNIYEIVTPSGRTVYPPAGYSWRLSKERFAEYVSDNRIWFGETGNNVPCIKRFLSEVKQGITPSTIWNYSDVGHTDSANKELKKLFNDQKYFDYPKSIPLIKQICILATNSDDLILDFFAGSGTTAHAVMKLNAEDGGKRQFILVQIAEPIAQSSEAYKAGFKTIFEITKARIDKSADKIRGNFADFNGDLGFKIFETIADFRTLNTKENSQQEIYIPQTLTEQQKQDLLTTWRAYDGQPLTNPVQIIQLANYRTYLCGNNLYLLDEGFNSAQIKALIEKLDNDPNFVPNRIIFHSDLMESSKQKELWQALESYSNKKQLMISLIARF